MRFLIQRCAGLICGLALALPSTVGADTPRNFFVNENLYGVHVAGAQAWIVGYYGTILHSADRGLTWREQSSPVRNAMFTVRSVGANQAWITGSHGALLRGLDNGNSWRAVASDTTEHLLGSFWLDQTHGRIAGSRGVTLRTDDGGQSWQKTVVPGDFTFSAIWFATPLRGWIAGEFGVIFHTLDGGKSWQKQRSPVEVAFSSGESRNIFALLFTEADLGYAFGLDGLVLQTRNGKDWHVIRQRGDVEKSDGASHLFAAAAAADRKLWAAGERGTLLHADINAARWQRVGAAIPRSSLNGLALGGDFGLLVGNRGLVLRSDDNGRNWQRIKIALRPLPKDGAPTP